MNFELNHMWTLMSAIVLTLWNSKSSKYAINILY